MSRKEEYKEKNLLYLDEIASEEGIGHYRVVYYIR